MRNWPLTHVEPWDFCTHKHHDERSGQQAGPCPLHDAVAYCQFCAKFLFTVQELENHTGPGHYTHKFMRRK